MSFTITNQKTGSQFVAEADEPILDAALRQGIVFPYSCRGGTCGSCKAQLVSGEVQYENQPRAITEEERQAGKALLCQARAGTDITLDSNEIAASNAIEIKMLPCRVSELQPLAHDVMLMKLKLPASQNFNYLPGQYIDIMLRDGRRRSFSLASRANPGQELELHIRHVPGGHFTSRVFDSVKVKDLLRFQGPFGTFFLREDSTAPVILMAGGTGLAPIKAILEKVFDENSSREFRLFWGVRQARDLYFHEQLLAWVEQHPNFRYVPVLSEPLADDDWQGETGFVHETVLKEVPDMSAYEVYTCGPPVMIEAARSRFPAAGLDPDRLYFDSFDYAEDGN